MAVNGSTPTGENIWTTSKSSSMMTTARAASNAMPSVVLVPRRAVAAQRVVPQRAAAQEVAPRVVAVRVAEVILLQGNRTVAAVAPAVMTTMIITHRAAEVEVVEDNGYV